MLLISAGFLLDFISYPVIKGFTCAAAVTIGFGQVKVSSDSSRAAMSTQNVQLTYLCGYILDFITKLTFSTVTAATIYCSI